MTDSQTTELREKLDALRIKHFDYDKGGRTQTQWEAPDGKRHFTYETSNNPAKTARLVIAWHPTPEQAIAVTLGSGECENVAKQPDFKCSECGASIESEDGLYGIVWLPDTEGFVDSDPNFCPNCGKVVN